MALRVLPFVGSSRLVKIVVSSRVDRFLSQPLSQRRATQAPLPLFALRNATRQSRCWELLQSDRMRHRNLQLLLKSNLNAIWRINMICQLNYHDRSIEDI